VDSARAEVVAAEWLRGFAESLDDADTGHLARLMVDEPYWRDVLALSWDLHTYYGNDQIAAMLRAATSDAQATSIKIDKAMPVRLAKRAGQDVLEVMFHFETAHGECRGVACLVATEADGTWKAWTVLTALDQLSPAPGEVIEDPAGQSTIRDFSAPNWLDRRLEAATYHDREPAVVIVGAGQAGLAVAARLRQENVDALIVDKVERVGDNWRKRYHSLVLHNEVYANHLPYLPFPGTWPTYIPKDLLADWFEAYATFMELNVWTSAEFVGGEYDPVEQSWTVQVERADGTKRVLKPRHIIMASGVSSIPYRPDIPGLADFAGETLHSSQYTSGEKYAGRRVTVIGTGTSGHDIAQDLSSKGADVTLVQRSPSTVVSVGPNAAGKVYSLYAQGLPIDVTDLINVSTPYPVLCQSYQLLTRELADQDSALLAGLQDIGFKIDFGTDNTGFQMKYLRKGGGYYLNVGCSDLLISGKVALLQYSDIDEFGPSGAVLGDGTLHAADVVILATGYYGQQEVVRKLFGETVADRVGPIWGYDSEGELRNMWRPTPQPGLWFTAGSLAQARIFSKYLALQIKAREDGRGPVSGSGGAIRESDHVDLWAGREWRPLTAGIRH
jgi:cation diffusion facilitator CzcD-associated flavoprotein CzcO